MKKKLFVLGTCLLMMAGLTACGGGSSIPYDAYDLNEYIKVGKYKGLEVEDYTVSITEEEIDTQIQTELEAAAETKELDQKTEIAEGDTANIDYVGKINGKKFDGGSAEGYDLVIGSGSFIDGFESGLIGKKVGEKVKLDLTFPEDYDAEELKGKDVVFDVTINSATREIVPEYDLDYVKNNTDYETIEDYEAAVEKQLYEDKEAEAIMNQKTSLWSKALENTEVKEYPEEELRSYIAFNDNQLDEMAESYGMTREEVLSSYGMGDEEEFDAVNEDSSKLRVKQEMTIMYIADAEGIEYTEEEKEALIAEFEAAGYDEETIQSQTGRNVDEYAHIELLYGKVLDFLLENAEITDASTVSEDSEASEKSEDSEKSTEERVEE